MTNALIIAEGLSKHYLVGGQTLCALEGVSLAVSERELVAVMGPSGSGKSTLLNLLGCLDQPSAGRYWLEGRPIEALSGDELASIRNRRIGFVFQSFNLISTANMIDNVALPLIYTGLPGKTRRQRAAEALRLVGLDGHGHHHPSQLSGGQQQRAAIARALVNSPALILADEPTGSLERRSGLAILSLFEQLNRAGTTVILVTHDPLVAAHARRVIRLEDGALVSDDERTTTPGNKRAGAP